MPYDYDYELDVDLACPLCGHSPTHFRSCSGHGCDGGWVDEADEDPINFSPGESRVVCIECWGFGVERWCPACDCDIAGWLYDRDTAVGHLRGAPCD